MENPSNKDFGDVETERRLSQRLAQQNLNEDDYIVKIIEHKTKGGKSRAKTQYLCYWNRGAVLTKEKLVKLNTNMQKDSDLRDLRIDMDRDARYITEETEKTVDHTTWQTYRDILLFKNGEKAIEIYKTLHPTAKFRD